MCQFASAQAIWIHGALARGFMTVGVPVPVLLLLSVCVDAPALTDDPHARVETCGVSGMKHSKMINLQFDTTMALVDTPTNMNRSDEIDDRNTLGLEPWKLLFPSRRSLPGSHLKREP